MPGSEFPFHAEEKKHLEALALHAEGPLVADDDRREKVCPASQSSSSGSRAPGGPSCDDSSRAERRKGKADDRYKSKRKHSEERKVVAERNSPEVATEFKASAAATDPEGLSVFQLNPTSITPAVEEMMVAFEDHPYLSLPGN